VYVSVCAGVCLSFCACVDAYDRLHEVQHAAGVVLYGPNDSVCVRFDTQI